MATKTFTKDDPAKALTKALSENSRARRAKHASEAKLDAVASHRGRNSRPLELTMIRRPLAELYAPTNNIRKIESDHVSEVAQSLARYDQRMPILTTREGEIIDGVIVVEAARLLGFEDIACVIAEDLSPTEVKLFRASLNRLGEKGSYDLNAFKSMLEEVFLEEEIVELPGFEPEELDLILLNEEPGIDAKANAEEAPDENHPVVAKLGDTFALGVHKLTCGDARDGDAYERLFEEGEAARLIESDFPYGCPNDGFTGGKGRIHHRDFVGGTSDLDADGLHDLITQTLTAATRRLVDGGLIMAFMDWRGIETLLHAIRLMGLMLLNVLVWNKGKGGMGGLYRNAHELIAVAKHGTAPHLDRVKLGKFGRDRTNVMTYAGATTPGSSAHKALADHPTPKSVELIADLLLDTTARGEIVLDPFAGSGTIFIAAQKTGRRAYGIELDPLYVDLIIRRFEKFAGIQAVHLESGATYSELMARRTAEHNPENSTPDKSADDREFPVV